MVGLLVLAIFLVSSILLMGIPKYTSHRNRLAETEKLRKRVAAKAGVVYKDGRRSKTIFDCTKYSERLFEQKLVDAGVINVIEMTLCDDELCPNCYTTRQAKSDRFNEVRKKQRPQLLVPQKESVCTCIDCERDRQRWKKSVNHRSSVMPFKPRTRVVNGYRVQIPDAVPSDANGAMQTDHAGNRNIMWSWQDERGQYVAFRQPFAQQAFEEFEIHIGDGTIIKAGSIDASKIVTTPIVTRHVRYE